ncbi:MOSC domain-containing protein [Rhodobacteraceae bacterium F11138]|nr:MOSC domain-containing protein [Rhodobacteraceae bacterium F11138]
MTAKPIPFQVAELFRYPMKSGLAEALTRARITPDGLAGDREWMVVDANGAQITAREQPALLLLSLTPTGDGGCRLTAPDAPALTVPPPQISAPRHATLFSDPLQVVDAGADAADWLTRLLDQPARLVHRHHDTRRDYGQAGYGRFGDVAPLLIVTRASLARLNATLGWPVKMDRFRPNIVLDGPEPHAEDGWTGLSIGDTTLEVIEPCIRCVMTTIDPNSGRKDLTGEPLRSLSAYRANDGGEVHFGVYAAVRRPGTVAVGDTVEVHGTTPQHRFVPATCPTGPDPLPDRRVLRLLETTSGAEGARHLWWRFEDEQATPVHPGQFVSLRIPQPNGQDAVRSYTISAQRRDGREIRLSIRRQGSGGVSDFMVRKARPGDTIWATGVHGSFTMDAPDQPALFLSAGSGVTPFLAMLAGSAQLADAHHIHMDRVAARAIGLSELHQAQTTQPGYRFTPVWTADQGRIGAEVLAQVPALLSRQVWICGPDSFVTDMRAILNDLGVPDHQVLVENFATPVTGTATGETFQVTLDGHPPVQVDAGVPLLHGLRKAGLQIPSSCEMGTCGTCKLQLLEGKCTKSAPGDDSPDHILPCTSYARSDLRLARPKS